MTAERAGLLSGGDEKVLELGSGDVQRSEYTECQLVVHSGSKGKFHVMCVLL